MRWLYYMLVIWGYLDIVKFLVKGAIINTPPLLNAIIEGRLNIVEFLVQNGANIHADNEKALKWASYYGHLDIVKFLIEKGVDKRQINEAIEFANSKSHVGIVNYLSKVGRKHKNSKNSH